MSARTKTIWTFVITSVALFMAKPDESRAARTGASGRRFQPSSRAGLATQALSAPFRYAQRPFYGTRLGAGLFAVARREG